MLLPNSFRSTVSLCCLLVAGLGTAHAQMNMGPETARAIPDGGIKVPGWAGKVDASATM